MAKPEDMEKKHTFQLSYDNPAHVETAEHLKRYYGLARDIRGNFIEQTIWIDHVLSELLADYFCEDAKKRALLFSEVISGVDSRFSSRISLLKTILHLHRPDLEAAYSSVCEKLDKVRRFRNRLAHSHVKADPEDIAKSQDGRITFCFYEDGVEKEYVASRDDSQLRLNEATNLLVKLLELREKLNAPSGNKES